jgi:hypothetical protein
MFSYFLDDARLILSTTGTKYRSIRSSETSVVPECSPMKILVGSAVVGVIFRFVVARNT